MEKIRNDVRADKDLQKAALGKRLFRSFASKNFEAGGSSGFTNKPMYGKQPQQSQG